MTAETTMQIAGMHCGHCAERLSAVLRRSDGVIKADVDVAGRATVRFDETRLDQGRLAELVRGAGFDVAGDEYV